MQPSLVNVGAKLGTGGQATVFESCLAWKTLASNCDTQAESGPDGNSVEHQAVAVKAFTGIKAHDIASNEQGILAMVESLSIYRDMVRSNLSLLIFRAREIP